MRGQSASFRLHRNARVRARRAKRRDKSKEHTRNQAGAAGNGEDWPASAQFEIERIVGRRQQCNQTPAQRRREDDAKPGQIENRRRSRQLRPCEPHIRCMISLPGSPAFLDVPPAVFEGLPQMPVPGGHGS